jgi:hypothetical protein
MYNIKLLKCLDTQKEFITFWEESINNMMLEEAIKQDQRIREQLEELGWIPPEKVKIQKDRIEELEVAISSILRTWDKAFSVDRYAYAEYKWTLENARELLQKHRNIGT